MSDLADRLFNELVAIQVTHGGDIPPDMGREKIRQMLLVDDELQGLRLDRDIWKRSAEEWKQHAEWRTVIVGPPIIRKLLSGEDVTLETFHINLIPDDALHNNRTDVAVLFGDDVLIMERIFKARELLGGKKDERSIRVERNP